MKWVVTPVLATLTAATGIGSLGLAVVAQTTAPKVVTSSIYRCDAGKSFSAEYRDDSTVQATFGSKVLVLKQVESASGAKYSDGSVTVFTKGDEASVDVGDKKVFTNCVAASGAVPGRW